MPFYPGVAFVQAPTVHPPAPADPGRTHYVIWWEGWDGSNWSLSDEDSGLIMMRGARGFGGIEIENHRDDHASLAGSRWRDYRALNRQIFLPIHLFSDGDSKAWVEHNRAFTKTMRAGKTGWLHIIHPDGQHRRIQARYEKGLDEAFEMDPAFYGWGKYGIYMVAEQPYWESAEPIPGSWKTADPVYLFGAGTEPGNGPPFGIVDDRKLETATLTNPGDVEAWPIWTYYGPGDSAAVGVDGKIIDIPIALTAGQWIRIDTNPQVQTAVRENGDEVTDQLGSFDFTEIPAGEDVQLDIELNGLGGMITVELTPLWEWGLS